MAIYSCNISNVSRAKGSSSCASLSYITSEQVYDERLGQTFYGFGRSERIESVNTLLPDSAPERFKNPSILFNEIEMYEKADNARTAKKIMVALPREFNLELQKNVIENYIKNNLTSNGYAVTYAIHTDKENNNPHAHLLIANRQINDKGEWQKVKTKKEYALDENGQRIPIIDERTGQQKLDSQNRKQWKRVTVNAVPPLDRKDFLKQLREEWATECNKHLEPEQRIDHRSLEEQGIERTPTIHEGYTAHKIERNGGISGIMQQNREIKKTNEQIEKINEQLSIFEKMRNTLLESIKRVKEGINERLERLKHRRDDGHNGTATRRVGADEEPNARIPSSDTETAIRKARAVIDNANATEQSATASREHRESVRERLNTLSKRRTETIERGYYEDGFSR